MATILVGGLAARSSAETQALSDKLGRVIHVEIQGVKDGTVEVVRDDGRRFTIPFADLSSGSQEEVRKWHARQNDPYREIDERVRPGERFFLSFPELADRNGGTPPRAGVSVPGAYHPEKPVPLLLWFGGGKGSSNPDGARGLVDPDAFVIVALPYPENRLPRLAVDDGSIDGHWEMQRPMLERVLELIPNIDEKVRIAGGSSSGAHNAGSGLDQEWDGFHDYFNAFVLHEGGYSPDMEFDGARRKRVLVIFGENSRARNWQMTFNKRIEDSRAEAEFIEVPGAGHGLNRDGRKKIREWIETVAVPGLREE